jgi:hypothetical protein
MSNESSSTPYSFWSLGEVLSFVVWCKCHASAVNRDSDNKNVTFALPNITDWACFDLYVLATRWRRVLLRLRSYRGCNLTRVTDVVLVIEGFGCGGILCMPSMRASADQPLADFLLEMRRVTARPLSD